jgi:hypothetical protein
LVLEPPTTGSLSLTEPEIEIAVVGGIAPPPPAYEDTEMLRGKPVVENFEEQSFTSCGPTELEVETIEGEIELQEEEVVVGDIEWVEEVPEIYFEQDPLPIPPPPPPFDSMPMVMGIVAMEPPRPTGIDWVKDTLKYVLPSLPTLPSKAPSLHQRPRPEMLQHLEALMVFPNPFVDHLKIEIDLPIRATLMVELLDPTGRLLLAQSWKADAGVNTLKIEPKQRKLKHALYYLRVTNEEGGSVQRAVIRGGK